MPVPSKGDSSAPRAAPSSVLAREVARAPSSEQGQVLSGGRSWAPRSGAVRRTPMHASRRGCTILAMAVTTAVGVTTILTMAIQAAAMDTEAGVTTTNATVTTGTAVDATTAASGGTRVASGRAGRVRGLGERKMNRRGTRTTMRANAPTARLAVGTAANLTRRRQDHSTVPREKSAQKGDSPRSLRPRAFFV